MNLSEIPALLRDIGVSPVKTLGQNFLHDHNLARWIIDQANLTPDDYVVEIGPLHFESASNKVSRLSESYLVVAVDVTKGVGKTLGSDAGNE